MSLMSVVMFNFVCSMEPKGEDKMETEDRTAKKRKLNAITESLPAEGQSFLSCDESYKDKLETFRIKIQELSTDEKKQLLNFLEDQMYLLQSELDAEQKALLAPFLKLPNELLLHIFGYCLAMPTKFDIYDLEELIKQTSNNFIAIISVCKNLSVYKPDLLAIAKKYFNRMLLIISSSRFSYNQPRDLQRPRILNMLLKAGADVNIQDENENGNTLFMRWLYLRYMDHLKITLESNPDLDLRNNDGDTALIFCTKRIKPFELQPCDNECINLMPLIMIKKIDVNAKNNDGDTALICLVKSLKDSTLLEHGLRVFFSDRTDIDVNAQDKDGNTAVMILIVDKGCLYYQGAVEFLISKGADLNIKNNDKKDALALCCNQNRTKFIKQKLKFLKK